LPKSRSVIFGLCEEYYTKSLEHDAIASSYANIKDQNDSWNDYSYHDVDPFLKIVKSYKKKIEAAEPMDYYDELAKKIILIDMDNYINDADDLWPYTYFGSVFSEAQSLFEVFEVMPKDTRKDVLNIIKRLEKMPVALNQWAHSLKIIQSKGHSNAKMRIDFVIAILNNLSDGKISKYAETVDKDDKRLMKAAREAEMAFEQLSAWLEAKYKPLAEENWRVGKQRYIKTVKDQSGLTIDPKKVYYDGMHELSLINEQMWEVGKQIDPNATKLSDFSKILNNDPEYIIEGVDNFKAFLEGVTSKAIKDMSGKYFTIPVAIKKCEVVMDEDTIDESPYYKGPSDDLQRPGKTYYPTLGRTKFTTWENYSTWFHESVPGHHMQIATSTLNKETLSVYQREYAWNSGYGEGWALYSEKLMDELGYFDKPGYKMGYLMCQAMRAARMVVDVGLHLGYKYPDGDGQIWTPELAVEYMKEKALLNHSYAVSEVNRYISWAGQAITYKLGEKVWLDAREDAKKRLGNKFDLKKFHMYALKLGPMGLDMLKEELLKWDGK
jgi:uncharacterized protein (DUF885 family)